MRSETHPGHPQNRSRREQRGHALIPALLLVTLGLLLGLALSSLLGTSSGSDALAPRVVTARGNLASDERSTIELFEEAAPSVVFITSIALRRDFFSLNVERIPRGTGSGFVWDGQGHVVTNFHVIQGASAAQVTLQDRSTWDAEVVGIAPEKDLAVLRIKPRGVELRPLAIGTSSDLRVGQKAFAIGNPFGLDQTLTTGIISALGREIDSVARIAIRDVIQTDAAINPGNSGGPLLDSAGRLIGVNTAIYSPSGTYAGIGFAIPVDTVKWVVPELITRGRIERPTLGVEMVSAAPVAGMEGALIVRVVPGSGADRAGLRGTVRDRLGRVRLGDVIVRLDDQPVRSPDDLILLLERRTSGESVAITLLRDGREQKLELELGAAARR